MTFKSEILIQIIKELTNVDVTVEQLEAKKDLIEAKNKKIKKILNVGNFGLFNSIFNELFNVEADFSKIETLGKDWIIENHPAQSYIVVSSKDVKKMSKLVVALLNNNVNFDFEYYGAFYNIDNPKKTYCCGCWKKDIENKELYKKVGNNVLKVPFDKFSFYKESEKTIFSITIKR